MARNNSRMLTEFESKELLKKAGIPIVATKLAKSADEAVILSRELGFPVALKINSVDVVHKSDAGGIKLNLNSGRAVSRAYNEIISAVKKKYPDANVQGVSVQKMAPPGTEVIIGMTRDAQFGPVIMFGLGGVLVELLKDVSFRVVPLDTKDAESMIKEVKGYPLLAGYRGRDAVSMSALTDIIVKLSQFVEKNPQIKELDLNPVLAYRDSALAVDARVLIDVP